MADLFSLVRPIVARLHPPPVQVIVETACHSGVVCDHGKVGLLFELQVPLSCVGDRLAVLVCKLKTEGLHVAAIDFMRPSIPLDDRRGEQSPWLFLVSLSVRMDASSEARGAG